MNVKTLDNKDIKWRIKGHCTNTMSSSGHKSAGHETTRELIREIFPTYSAYEEVGIPVLRHKFLYLDFYIPQKNLAIEVHGEQHFKYIPFFHQNKIGFMQSQKNDRMKSEWCIQNGVKLVVLNYNEDVEEWNKKLKES